MRRLWMASVACALSSWAQQEIPVPKIHGPLGEMPGVKDLPVRAEMPDVLVMNDGTRVTTPEQWSKRREEMRRTLAYYATGQMPPPPGNVKGQVVSAETVLEGKVRYRQVRLTFGPQERLSLNIGVFTPQASRPLPAIILLNGTPPGAAALPRLPNGPNQGKGENVLVLVGPEPPAVLPAPPPAPPLEKVAAQHENVFRRGFALVVFNPNDCAEDTTLRNLDGSWAFRNTRFYPAYPGYDWGILAGWAWGASRIADYLETDTAIDKTRMIVTGASRSGKAAMIAAAFDDRLMGAPVVTGGGGIGAYRFAGPNRSETLDLMETKYPNWFSPNLVEFRGQRERLPFDQHFFLALAAPRPFIALEGETDTISLPEAVRQSVAHADPAYALLGMKGRIAIHYSQHGHAFTAEDWTAMMDYFTREYAWDVLRARVKEQRYLDHALAVEQLTRSLARPEDNVEEYGLAGLLHDVDIAETANDLSRHGTVGARWLRELGFSEAVVHAVLAHDDRAGVTRESRLDRAVYCADQWYWLQRAADPSKRPVEQMRKECGDLLSLPGGAR